MRLNVASAGPKSPSSLLVAFLSLTSVLATLVSAAPFPHSDLRKRNPYAPHGSDLGLSPRAPPREPSRSPVYHYDAASASSMYQWLLDHEGQRVGGRILDSRKLVFWTGGWQEHADYFANQAANRDYSYFETISDGLADDDSVKFDNRYARNWNKAMSKALGRFARGTPVVFGLHNSRLDSVWEVDEKPEIEVNMARGTVHAIAYMKPGAASRNSVAMYEQQAVVEDRRTRQRSRSPSPGHTVVTTPEGAICRRDGGSCGAADTEEPTADEPTNNQNPDDAGTKPKTPKPPVKPKPAGPAGPAAPEGPTAPEGPAGPEGPAAPTGPSAPDGPEDPADPTKPKTPKQPKPPTVQRPPRA